MKKLDVDNSERFCVFQSGEHWFGVSSLFIRSVVLRPTTIRAPFSDPILKGICHLQNEFVPVLSLRALMNVEYESAPDGEKQMIVMIGSQGPWGLLIDRAVGLVPLETSISTFSDGDDHWSKVVIGSASYSSHVVQVLDAAAVNQYASTLLNSFWLDPVRNDHISTIHASAC